MNKIYQLLDEAFVRELFKKEVLPLYPAFKEIGGIRIIPHKKLIWETTYHVVIEFKTDLLDDKGGLKTVDIFCSAHSHEPRKNVYEALRFLWHHDFDKGGATIPHPLFYSDYFRATFYEGVRGDNLYHFIKIRDRAEIERIVDEAAAWFAKLHRLPVQGTESFRHNSRIKNIVPGVGHILEKIKEKHPEYYDRAKTIYERLIAGEEKFLDGTEKRWLVHGDAHPENIIKTGDAEIGVIDFTDLCLSDFARDLGGFLQQVEYMCERKIGDAGFCENIKKIFLESYLKHAKIDLDPSLKERIDLYYNWTAFRTAIFFLTSHLNKVERAEPLFDLVSKNLKI